MGLSRGKRGLFFTLALALLLAALGRFFGAEPPLPAVRRFVPSKVAVVQARSATAAEIGYGEIRALVREAVSLAGGFAGLIRDGQVVMIKPNLVWMCDYTLPGWRGRPLAKEANGSTTDWRVVRALVELVREFNPGGKVYVMEGSGGGSTRGNMKHLNYTAEYIPGVDAFLAIEEDSGPWLDFDSPGLVRVELPDGLLHKEYYLNRKYKEADVVISVPCLKNHWSAAVSGGIKNVGIGATPANIYGIGPGDINRNNMVAHDAPAGDLHKWIRDFYKCRPVDFVLMDGLQGIQNGPTPCYEISRTTDIRQDQMNMRLILAGRDAVAVDTIESLIMGWDPGSVKHLRYLNHDGLGNLDPACIEVLGRRVDEVRKFFAGRPPRAGGEKIADTLPPGLAMAGWQAAGSKLLLSLDAAPETVKLELELDGRLWGKALTSGFERPALDLGGLAHGRHQLSIHAYDRFLNRAEAVLAVTKGADGSLRAEPVPDDSYRAPRASTAPALDGRVTEGCWAAAPWRELKHLWLGAKPAPADFSGRYKAVWTPEKLYLLVEITDDRLSDTHPDGLVDYYQDDCLEIFLDENRSGGDHTYNYNAFAYHIALDGKVADLGPDRRPLYLTDHMKIKRTRAGNVHTWEIAIDVYDDRFDHGFAMNKPIALYAGKRMGLAVAYCDNDGGADRESFVGSEEIQGSDKNIAWRNADVFGGLILEE